MLVDNQLPDTRPDMSKFNSNSSLDSMDKVNKGGKLGLSKSIFQ